MIRGWKTLLCQIDKRTIGDLDVYVNVTLVS